jgi:predicted DNA-binding protein
MTPIKKKRPKTITYALHLSPELYKRLKARKAALNAETGKGSDSYKVSLRMLIGAAIEEYLERAGG